MKKRLITGAIMLSILLPLVIIDSEISKILYLCLAMFMSFVGSYEYVSKAFKDRPEMLVFKIIVPIFSCLLTMLTLCTAASSTSNVALVLIDELKMTMFKCYALTMISFLFAIAIIYMISLFIKSSSGKDVEACVNSLVYTGLMLGVALSIRLLEPIGMKDSFLSVNGTKSFLYVYTIVIMTDSFAFLFGKAFGKNKLCPEISPNKTKEGALAGLIGGSICGVIGLYVYGIIPNWEHAFIAIPVGLVVSAVLSCTVQMGDLIESKFKRTYEVKDFGNILPGHGGILDRFDSFIYSGTMFYIIIIFMELIIFG